MMECYICGREFGYEEKFYETEERDLLCANNHNCHNHYMEDNITIKELLEYLDHQGKTQKVRQQLIQMAKDQWDKDDLREWYIDGFTICENDEPDEETIREWELERAQANSDYFNSRV